MKIQVGGVGRLNDPDGVDEGPDVTQRVLPAGSHCPGLGPLLLGIFISDLDENINYNLYNIHSAIIDQFLQYDRHCAGLATG